MAKVFKDYGNSLPSAAPKPLQKKVDYSSDNFVVGSPGPLREFGEGAPGSSEKQGALKGASLPKVESGGRFRETKFG